MARGFSELNSAWVQDAKTKELIKTYTIARDRITRLLADVDNVTEYQAARFNNILVQVNEIIVGLNKKASNWSGRTIKPVSPDSRSMSSIACFL